MSTKCLVTKLKAVINNENLPYFNTVRIDFPTGVESGNSFTIGKQANLQLVLKSNQPVFDGQYILSWNSSHETTKTVHLDYCNVPFRIFISKKTDIAVINILSISNCNLNIDELRYAEQLYKLDYRNANNSGDIISVGYMKYITDLIMPYAMLTGTIESAAETFIENYPTENKTLNINLNRSAGGSHTVTFNGVIQNIANSTLKIIFNNGSASVYLVLNEEDTLLGSYDGSTWTYNS